MKTLTEKIITYLEEAQRTPQRTRDTYIAIEDLKIPLSQIIEEHEQQLVSGQEIREDNADPLIPKPKKRNTGCVYKILTLEETLSLHKLLSVYNRIVTLTGLENLLTKIATLEENGELPRHRFQQIYSPGMGHKIMFIFKVIN